MNERAMKVDSGMTNMRVMSAFWLECSMQTKERERGSERERVKECAYILFR